MTRFVPILSIVLAAAGLAACTGLAGSSGGSSSTPASNSSGDPAAVTAGFARFTDIPMPAKNSIDLDRTIIFGGDRDWIGRISLSTSMSVNDSYDFFKSEMPRLGWTELTSVRSATSVLSFQMDNRVATIQIASQRFGGTQVDLWMNPRSGGGASAFSAGGSAGPAPQSGSRSGGIDQGTLAPARR